MMQTLGDLEINAETETEPTDVSVPSQRQELGLPWHSSPHVIPIYFDSDGGIIHATESDTVSPSLIDRHERCHSSAGDHLPLASKLVCYL
jgi:hypothetical protein